MFSPFDTDEEKLNKIIEKIQKLDILTEEESYKIYFTPTSVKKYIELVIKKQTNKKYRYFPCEEKDFERYFSKVVPDFNYEVLKYNSSSNLEIISKIIANQGKSGYSYLENIEKVINLNKPTLMFYGIEQIAAFFRNLHFNFTDENTKYNSIKKKFQRHGIDAFEFKSIDIDISLDELLNKKIQLKIEGFSPIFFLLNLSKLYDTSIDLFIEEKKIPFSELLRNFFLVINNHIPNLIRKKFEEDFGSDWPKIKLNSIVLTNYLLSFLFSHISRYKMHTWLKLIGNDEKNISYYVNYIIKYGHVIYTKTLFNRLFHNEMILGGTYHPFYY